MVTDKGLYIYIQYYVGGGYKSLRPHPHGPKFAIIKPYAHSYAALYLFFGMDGINYDKELNKTLHSSINFRIRSLALCSHFKNRLHEGMRVNRSV